jgi:uncharacterized protein
MSLQNRIDSFLAGKRFAVVGASQNREKYGNKVLRTYQQNKLEVVPINPTAGEIEGLAAAPNLSSLPAPVDGISVITPPKITEQVVKEAIDLGIKHIWLQPGAESQAAIEAAERAGVNLISGGPCLLVVLRYRED